ncbi:Adaptor protein complex AP-1 gamma subunit [Basidiobolus meristosporus CBS 931.73]|uniref:AP-1 complex subunit gamma n=1 Tax=Basidiobolus meristosporus CBS 931.73 TaxID=1314790 RepID=A0A1Y1YJ89_9FUNG|nr:Adaptor protein complex AP-1 gamma subunit [Basidiobolus meristosporus CBS 931.73]|eukprot:ORX98052.1 Adaptor protein complex AP-1 gamma subunit [Basidiobolus meristosporus CBS 931.73]
MVYFRLKDLIRAIRRTKTAADERAVIQKESAAIRTAFREENSETRYHNVSKLLYIHMLGYPAHFGQIDCLKLVASPHFGDKRLGYLGTMLLLDENQEVLTLLTNSLKNDLNHSNMHIVGLALCTLGNIASEDVAKDLVDEVERLMENPNAYLRRKAALCAIRLIRKAPELEETFVLRAKSLIADKNHGVMLTGITLMIELCTQNPENVSSLSSIVPTLVSRLRTLATSGFSPEHDVGGLTDPFLQVKILRLLRILGEDNPDAVESMNDILTQVATSTDSAKNVGNSILYETVLTIMETDSDSSLRVLAINILGRFLTNRDNNIRYVALNTLNKTAIMDMNAIQRHRETVVKCLRDPDISIRRRALELSFALINDSNVRVMIRELLSFLEVAETEFKQSLASKIRISADRYAPNQRWHIDTLLRVLKLAGNYVGEEIVSSFIGLVCRTPELQPYTVKKLFVELKSDISQEGLVLAGVWCIGEFGDVLVQHQEPENGEEALRVTEGDILDLFETLLNSPYANRTLREYMTTSLMKLADRFHDPSVIPRIQSNLRKYSTSMEAEVQQRAVEYQNLFKHDEIRNAVFERMPAPEIREREPSPVERQKSKSKKRAVMEPKEGDLLLDLLGDNAPTSPAPTSNLPKTVDLLADIFGSTNISTPALVTNPNGAASTSSGNGLADLLGETPSSPANPNGVQSTLSPRLSGSPAAPASNPISPSLDNDTCIAYNKNGLRIEMDAAKDSQNPKIINIKINFVNTSEELAIEDLAFQVAVPKTQRLQMQPPSSTAISVGESAVQLMRVANPQQTPIRLRMKISFQAGDGHQVEEVAEFSGFPSSLTN